MKKILLTIYSIILRTALWQREVLTRPVFVRTIVFVFSFCLFASFALAANDSLPEPMVGQTKVTSGDGQNTYWGGFEGNEAVFNHTNNTGQSPLDPAPPESLGPSLKFDGVDDYLETNVKTDAGRGPIASLLPNSSIEAWVKRVGDGPAVIYEETFDSGGSTLYPNFRCNVYFGCLFYFGLGISLNNQPIFSVFNNSNPDGHRQRTSVGSELTPNVWHYLAATFDSTNGGMKLYVDGVFYGSNSWIGRETIFEDNYEPNVTIGPVGPIRIGYDAGASPPNILFPSRIPQFFKGNIDEVRVLSRTLTETDIANRWTGATTNASISADSVLAYWDFSDQTNPTKNLKNTNYYGTLGCDPISAPCTDRPTFDTTDPKVFTVPPADTGNGYYLFGFDDNPLTRCVTESLLGTADHCFVKNY